MNHATVLYVAINISIGVGIAADAMLATIARARTFGDARAALKWAAAIGFTHWLFPMCGLLGGWYLATHGIARAIVYGVGGTVLLAYVIQVLRERSLVPSDGSLPPQASFWLAVWGVSIDALITGPGKAAATAHWTPAQVAISFPLVGAVVFVLVLISTVPAMALHRRIATVRNARWQGVGVFFSVATWVEVLVFTWFATLSLVETLEALNIGKASYAKVSVYTAALGALLVIMLGPKIWRAQGLAARNLVSKDSV